MTGAVDRLLATKLDALPVDQIAHYLGQVRQVEDFIAGLRALAEQMLTEGKPVGDWKLVPRRPVRQWADDGAASRYMENNGVIVHDLKMKTPAAVEKELKRMKIELPADLVVAVSSGNTLAPGNDPRPAVLQIGHTLKKAMAKIQ
jgi:hypothetical protein